MTPVALAALSLAAKATLLFAAAGVAAAALHRSSAAARHLAWTLAVVGALALPLVSAVTPGWSLPLLPRQADEALATLPSVQVPVVAAPPGARSPGVPVQADEWTSGTAASGSVGAHVPAAPSPQPAGGLGIDGANMGWTTLLVGLYVLGVALVLGRMAAGAWALGRIGRSASAPRGEGWSELLRDVCWTASVERPVRLVQAADAAMPMTWGITRAVVLLPAGAEEWTDERRRVVLLHELAHVARRDCLTQWLAGLACALYWFHPAAWYAARRLRVERERACDDRVLAAGTRGADYAAHLLEVARAFRAPALAAALSVPMARPSQLEGRLLAVLNGARRPARLTRRGGMVAALATAGLVLPLAAMRPAPRSAAPALTERSAGPTVDATAPSGTSGTKARHVGTAPSIPTSGSAMAVASTPDGWQAPQQEQTIERTVAARPGGWLVLDLDTGGDVNVQPWDRNEVWVRARLGGRDWRSTRVTVSRDGDEVRVRSGQTVSQRSVSTSHEFEVRVPRRFSVRLSSAGGGVTITGLTGSFRGHTGGGEMDLSNLSGDVDLTTGGGEVRVADSNLSGRVSTGGGGIRLTRVRGGLRGWSGSDGEAEVGGGSGANARFRQDEKRAVAQADAEARAAARAVARADAQASAAAREQARAEAQARRDASRAEVGYAYATGGEQQRIAAVDAIEDNAPPAAAAAALARFAFEDPSPRVQLSSVRALARMDDDAAVQGLARIARTHRSLPVRRAAVEALARCECPTSTGALRDVSRGDADAGLRRAAARALERRAAGAVEQ